MIPVVATLSQLATGLRIGDGARASCTDCDTELREGAAVVVRLRRSAKCGHWSVEGVFCNNCGSESVLEDRESALVSARVGVTSDAATQTNWPCLVDPVPVSKPLRRPDARFTSDDC